MNDQKCQCTTLIPKKCITTVYICIVLLKVIASVYQKPVCLVLFSSGTVKVAAIKTFIKIVAFTESLGSDNEYSRSIAYAYSMPPLVLNFSLCKLQHHIITK